MHYEQFQDGTVKCIEDEIPFEIPEGWAWTRLGTAFTTLTGSTPSTQDKSLYGNEYPFYKPTDLDYGFYIECSKDMVSLKGYNNGRITPQHSILVTCIGATIGKTGFVRNAGICNQQINAIVPNPLVYMEYFYFLFCSKYMQQSIKANASATTLPILNKSGFDNLLVPMSPLKQQEKITNVIIDTFSFVENIEKDADFLEKCISVIKSKILDLAIRGKLVPQDPNDEPASVLLERIRAEKENLIKQGKIKRDKKESIIFKGEDNSYYEKYGEKLPAGWVVTNFGTFLEYEQPTKYIVSNTNYKSSYETPVLTAGKSFILGYTNETNNVFNDLPVIIFDDFTTESKFVNFPFKVKSSAMKILHINTDLVFPQYAYYLIQATKIDHENHQRYWISAYSQEEVALPPLNEQKRILARLEYYFTLLDQIQ